MHINSAEVLHAVRMWCENLQTYITNYMAFEDIYLLCQYHHVRIVLPAEIR